MSSFYEALGSIDWRAFAHTGGSADDLPEVFARMERASVSEVNHLYGEIAGKLCTPEFLWSACAPTVQVFIELLSERPELWSTDLVAFVTYCAVIAYDKDPNLDPTVLDAIRQTVRDSGIPLLERIVNAEQASQDDKVRIARVLSRYAPESLALRTQLPAIVMGWCRPVAQRDQEIYGWAAIEFFELAERTLRGSSEWMPLLKGLVGHANCPIALESAAREAMKRS